MTNDRSFISLQFMMVSNCVTGGRGLIVAFTPASLPMSHDVTLSSS